MTAPDNAATVRALNEAYNNRDWDGAIALTAPEVTFVNVATGQVFHGPDYGRVRPVIFRRQDAASTYLSCRAWNCSRARSRRRACISTA